MVLKEPRINTDKMLYNKVFRRDARFSRLRVFIDTRSHQESILMTRNRSQMVAGGERSVTPGNEFPHPLTPTGWQSETIPAQKNKRILFAKEGVMRYSKDV